jgi:hypothetical protein
VRILLLLLAACAAHPGKNEVVARQGRSTAFRAQVTKATFDGHLTRIELGPRVALVIASCYAHAQQKIGDHDHVVIELDHAGATSGELDIADCTTHHVVATMTAVFKDGTQLESTIDTDLGRP